MISLTCDTFTTPFGKFSLAVNADGALAATAFGDETALRRRIAGCGGMRRDAKAAAAARGQIEEYFAGTRRGFSLPIAPAGTPFQNRVWTALADIPFGETRSYRDIATVLGQPGAARAVGRANAANPRCLIAPCHRVIGADGSLTGFAFGEEIKWRLIEFEQAGGMGSGNGRSSGGVAPRRGLNIQRPAFVLWSRHGAAGKPPFPAAARSGHPERNAASRSERHGVEGPGSNAIRPAATEIVNVRRTEKPPGQPVQESRRAFVPGPSTARPAAFARRGAPLRMTIFRSARRQCAHFRSVRARGARFRSVHPQCARFRSVHPQCARFRSARPQCARFRSVRARGARAVFWVRTANDAAADFHVIARRPAARAPQFP